MRLIKSNKQLTISKGWKKMKKSILIIFMAAIGLGLILGNLPSVHAQDIDEFTLEEITVTAQKREENLQKVPLAIESVSGIDLVEMGKVDFYDALSNLTPLTNWTNFL